MIPEATEPLAVIEAAVRDLFHPWLRCLLVKGSALKGDFIRHWSDLDVQAFLDRSAFEAEGVPRVDLALAFRERIKDLDPERYGFSEFQIVFLAYDERLDDASMPAPGTYRVRFGDAPGAFGRVTERSMLRVAARDLDEIDRHRRRLVTAVVDKPDSQLEPVVRRIGAVVKPYAYNAASIIAGSPFRVWNVDFAALSPILTADGLADVASFLDALRAWPRCRHELAYQRGLVHDGFAALAQTELWWATARDRQSRRVS